MSNDAQPAANSNEAQKKTDPPKENPFVEGLRKHPILTLALFGAIVLVIYGLGQSIVGPSSSSVQKETTTTTTQSSAPEVQVQKQASATAPVEGPSPEVQKQLADLQKQVADMTKAAAKPAPTNADAPAANAPDSDQDSAPAADGHHHRHAKAQTCEPGWNWDGNVCTREARPSAEQHQASIVRVKCDPGSTRVVHRQVMVDGHKVDRKVTQTCETL